MNTFGNKFRISVFGESHGPEIGVIMDGVPSGIALDIEDFTEDIHKRAGGALGTTPRKESDTPIILSGVYEGYTTGSPLTVVFRNENKKSADYETFVDVPRPGHADRTAALRFGGFQDPRGGGHFSGRITLVLVAAGVVAKKILSLAGDASVRAVLTELGGIPAPSGNYPENENESGFPQAWTDALKKAEEEHDSLGGIIECTVSDMPGGYGEPFFDSLESVISHIVFAIPGIRGIEFGDGFASSRMKGSGHNDPFGPDGRPVKNGSGGINGGISNGMPLHFRVAVKPTSSIGKSQDTFNFATETMDVLSVGGRHDVCFALRTPIVVEAATAIVLADMMM